MNFQEETGKVTFGGKVYDVAAFTFDELVELLEPLALSGAHFAAGAVRRGFAAGRPAIMQALKLDEAAMAEIKTDAGEIMAAIEEIGRVAGLKRLGEMNAARAKTPANPSAG